MTTPVPTIPPEVVDKLQIREVIERSMRYIDDHAGGRLSELFTADGVLQLAGTVFAGREAIRTMFRDGEQPPWWEPGQLLKQPGSVHRSSNPVIDVEADTARAETDILVLERDQEGRAKIALVGRYRDRLRRIGALWLISSRTGVSIARPGQAGTDAEWARALTRMPQETRAKFRME